MNTYSHYNYYAKLYHANQGKYVLLFSEYKNTSHWVLRGKKACQLCDDQAATANIELAEIKDVWFETKENALKQAEVWGLKVISTKELIRLAKKNNWSWKLYFQKSK